jgi:glucokinase
MFTFCSFRNILFLIIWLDESIWRGSMTRGDLWAIGVDLGGTKVEVAEVGGDGGLRQRTRYPTHAIAGPPAVKEAIVKAIRELIENVGSRPIGIGVGVAGQIDPRQGKVLFAPNLGWRNVPLRKELNQALRLPVVVLNDVRAATWGEWLYGSGKGVDDLICLFIGTGIGGGVVSNGKVLTGSNNSAGELGHIIIDLHGPPCNCGNRGCLEAFAGGWAIARQAQHAVTSDPTAGASLLKLANGQLKAITAEMVTQAAQAGDFLSRNLMDQVTEALVAGVASLVNALNPRHFIVGGGVIEGQPELVKKIAQGVYARALKAATASLQILPAKLKGNAGVIGAAALAIRSFKNEGGMT